MQLKVFKKKASSLWSLPWWREKMAARRTEFTKKRQMRLSSDPMPRRCLTLCSPAKVILLEVMDAATMAPAQIQWVQVHAFMHCLRAAQQDSLRLKLSASYAQQLHFAEMCMCAIAVGQGLKLRSLKNNAKFALVYSPSPLNRKCYNLDPVWRSTIAIVFRKQPKILDYLVIGSIDVHLEKWPIKEHSDVLPFEAVWLGTQTQTGEAQIGWLRESLKFSGCCFVFDWVC